MQFYIKDAIQVYEINGYKVADSAERAVSLLFIPLLIGALVSSISAGIISDRFGGRYTTPLWCITGCAPCSFGWFGWYLQLFWSSCARILACR
jgi:hypothetical protein